MQVLLLLTRRYKMNRTPRIVALTLTSSAGSSNPTAGLLTLNPAQLQSQMRGTLDTTNYEVALSSLDCTYSWPNLAAGSSISYIWVDGNTYNATIPAGGSYEISDLNNILVSQMTANGHYLQSTTESVVSNVYYLGFAFNPIYLTTTVTATPVPTSLTAPSGSTYTLTNPNSVPLNGHVPQLVVNSVVGAILGFSAGSYPNSGQTTTQVVNGSQPSILNPVTLVNVNTNLVNDPSYNTYSSAIHTFVPQGQFGDQISVVPTERVWYPVSMQKVQNVTVTLADQNSLPLPLIAGLPWTVKLYLRRVF